MSSLHLLDEAAIIWFIKVKNRKHFGESGGKPELSCSCMGSFPMAVPSQGHREAGNRVRVPNVSGGL
jgi:hypothetical protein